MTEAQIADIRKKGNDYISKYGIYVMLTHLYKPIFPSVTLGQAFQETGYGKGEIVSKHYNHFGIKADKAWTGAKVGYNTTEDDKYGNNYGQYSYFRSYPNKWQGFKDRITFLEKNKIYEKAGVFTASTPEGQIEALKRAGYATDTDYVSKIKWQINTHNLKRFDTLKTIIEFALPLAGVAVCFAGYKYNKNILQFIKIQTQNLKKLWKS